MYETGNHEQDAKRQIEALTKAVNELSEQLERLNDSSMGTFVQLSRMYDLLAAQAVGANTAGLTQLLDNHEDGIIYSSPPVLRSFNDGDNTASENSEGDRQE